MVMVMFMSDNVSYACGYGYVRWDDMEWVMFMIMTRSGGWVMLMVVVMIMIGGTWL